MKEFKKKLLHCYPRVYVQGNIRPFSGYVFEDNCLIREGNVTIAKVLSMDNRIRQVCALVCLEVEEAEAP
jgi:hypothetical protein